MHEVFFEKDSCSWMGTWPVNRFVSTAFSEEGSLRWANVVGFLWDKHWLEQGVYHSLTAFKLRSDNTSTYWVYQWKSLSLLNISELSVEVIPLTEEIRHGIFGWIHRQGISEYTFGKTNGGNQTVNIWIDKRRKSDSEHLDSNLCFFWSNQRFVRGFLVHKTVPLTLAFYVFRSRVRNS